MVILYLLSSAVLDSALSPAVSNRNIGSLGPRLCRLPGPGCRKCSGSIHLRLFQNQSPPVAALFIRETLFRGRQLSQAGWGGRLHLSSSPALQQRTGSRRGLEASRCLSYNSGEPLGIGGDHAEHCGLEYSRATSLVHWGCLRESLGQEEGPSE